jgi:hypothetical protein
MELIIEFHLIFSPPLSSIKKPLPYGRGFFIDPESP